MGLPSKRAVVLIRFPFSDLSQSKLRPAVVLASAGKGDWILCQITSQRYSDPKAIKLAKADFRIGSLRKTSFVRFAKLFTADECLIVSKIGELKQEKFSSIIGSIMKLFAEE